MEAKICVERLKTVEAYQYRKEHADEFIKWLWSCGYLVHSADENQLINFQLVDDRPQQRGMRYVRDTDFLVFEKNELGVETLSILSEQRFKEKYMEYQPPEEK